MRRSTGVKPQQKITARYLESMFDGLEDELLVIDSDFRIIKANQAVMKKHKKSLNEVVGHYCYQVSHGANELCHAPRHECPVASVWQTGKPSRVTHLHAYGESSGQKCKYIEVVASPILDDKGKVTCVAELLRDVTEARELELKMTEAHQNLVALNAIANAVSQSLDVDTVLNRALDKTLEIMKESRGGILLWDEDGTILRYRVHRGFSRQFVKGAMFREGDGVAGLAAQTGKSILIEDIASDPRCNRPVMMKAEGLHGFASIPLVLKDRTLGVLNIASTKRRRFSGQDVSLLESIAAQITIAVENARLHEEVQKQDQLRGELLSRIFTIQEEERHRIARELHDETTQSLVGMATSLEALQANLPPEMDVAKKTLKSLQDLSLSILDGLHRLIYELRPAILDDFGLVAAARSLVKQELETAGIKADFKLIGKEKRLPARLENTLFRVVQEAVKNISRHAQAKTAGIIMRIHRNSVSVSISDDGKGFYVKEAMSHKHRLRGLGLIGMKERVSLVNGTLKINSSPGKGTKITIEVPIGEKNDE